MYNGFAGILRTEKFHTGGGVLLIPLPLDLPLTNTLNLCSFGGPFLMYNIMIIVPAQLYCIYCSIPPYNFISCGEQRTC